MDSTPEPQPPVVPGYVLTLPLGTGAQGTVWRATRVADRADRAIKVVASCGADALAGSVDNPDMVRVHEVLTLGDGHVAVVMDLMDGGSLRGLVDARGVLTSGETVSLLVPLAQALGRLHALGLVHGDVSPDNVLLDADGRPRLIDLGAAHGRGLGAREVWGTGGFVAPEVAVGGADPTPASDVYAVGALGWFALTGREPRLGVPPFGRDRKEGVVSEPLRRALARAADLDPAERPDADRLADRVFAAATAEPLPTTGTDPGHGITRRIRAAMAEGAAAPTPPGRRDRLIAARRSMLGRRGQQSADRDTASAMTRLVRGLRVWLVPLVLTAGLLVLAGGAWGAIADRAAAGGGARAGTSAGSVKRVMPIVADSSPEPMVDPLHLRSIDVATATGLVQALADLRARAWSDPAGQAWHDLSAAGSPAATADTADREALIAAGERAEALTMTAGTVTIREGAGTDRLVLRSRIDVAAHRIISARGTREVAPTAGDPLDLEVRWLDGRWQLWSVSEPA
jgi:hypothetical protein